MLPTLTEIWERCPSCGKVLPPTEIRPTDDPEKFIVRAAICRCFYVEWPGSNGHIEAGK